MIQWSLTSGPTVAAVSRSEIFRNDPNRERFRFQRRLNTPLLLQGSGVLSNSRNRSTGRERFPVSPLARRADPALVPFPASRLQPGANPHLVALRPVRGLDPERPFEDLADGDVAERLRPLKLLVLPILVAGVTAVDAAGVMGEPAVDAGVPDVPLVPCLLLGPGPVSVAIREP